MKRYWRDGILYLDIIGMELCWLYTALAALNSQQASGQLSVLWLLLVLPAVFAFNKILPKGWAKPFVYGINVLACAAGTLLILKAQLYGGQALFQSAWLISLGETLRRFIPTANPEIIIIGGSIALWWLGWRLSRVRLSFTTAIAEFQFGLIILLFLFFLTSQLGIMQSETITISLLFFLFALAGMSLAHAYEGATWLSGSNRRLWSVLLIAGIVVILVLGLFAGSVMTHDFLQTILTPFKWLWGMFWKGVEYLINLIPLPKPVELPPELVEPPFGTQEPEGMEGWHIPEPLKTWLTSGYNIFFFGLLIVALWRISSQIVGWLRRRMATNAGAEVESLPGAFKADLLAWLKHIMVRLTGLRIWFWRRKQPANIAPEIASVRQIYRQFLRWAASNGWPRQVSQTPHEYLHILESLPLAAREELSFITEQYVNARYSPWSPSDEDIDRLSESWAQLRRKHGRSTVKYNKQQEVALNG